MVDLSSLRARLGPDAALSAPPSVGPRIRARARSRVHTPEFVGTATVAGRVVSTWNVGPEVRLVEGPDDDGTPLAFLRRDGDTSEVRHEPAGRAMSPPMGVASEPRVLVVGLLRNVASVAVARARLAPSRLVVVEPDPGLAQLALAMLTDDDRSAVDVREGSELADLLGALSGERFDLALVDTAQFTTGPGTDNTSIDLVLPLLSPHATLVVRREGGVGEPAPMRRFGAVRRCVVERRSAAELWFGSMPPVDGRPAADRASAPAARPLTVDTVTTMAGLRSLAPDWLELCRRCDATSAYQSPGWVIPWFDYFGGDSEVETLVIRRGDELVGVVPLARRSLGGRHGWTRLWSAGSEHGDYGEPPLADDRDEVADFVIDHLVDRVHRGRTAVDLRRLVDDGPLAAALARRHDVRIVPIQEMNVSAYVRFDLMDDPTTFLDKHAKKNRLAQKKTKLEAEVGDVRFVPSDPAVDEVLAFMRAQMADRFGDDGPKIFSTPRRSAFTAASTAQLVADGIARLSTIRAGERLLAVEIVHVCGAIHTWDFGAYDVSLARFSLGQMVLHEILRQAVAEQATAVDLRAGDFPYKYAWSNAGRVSRSYAMLAPGRLGDLTWLVRLRMVSDRTREMKRLDQSMP